MGGGGADVVISSSTLVMVDSNAVVMLIFSLNFDITTFSRLIRLIITFE